MVDGNTTMDDKISQFLPQILAAIPAGWRGTTFRNSNLLGREGFAARLNALLAKKAVDPSKTPITEDELVELGNAEDYLRVATNLSVILEMALAAAANLPPQQVFTFGSTTMSMVAPALVVGGEGSVKLYHGDKPAPLTKDQLDTLALLGGNLTLHEGAPVLDSESVVLADISVAAPSDEGIDGVIDSNVLYITNPDRIKPDDVLVIRKRMATPVTTPVAEMMLQQMTGTTVTANVDLPSEEGLSAFLEHLQVLSGTEPNPAAPPAVFTAGLPTIATLWTTLARRGGADVLMCSTAYGGSNQLTDIINSKVSCFTKHTFDIQGIDTDILERIKIKLDELLASPEKLHPTTVLFVEVPTNPDMKVPDVVEIARMLETYKNSSNREAVLLFDTTFAPGSQVMSKLRDAAPDLSALTFISLSKSVSRGLTTGGALVCNHTAKAIDIMKDIHTTAKLFDTTAKHDQLLRLEHNHTGVEDRTQAAYDVAVTAGKALQAAVHDTTGKEMRLAFVEPQHAALGFTSSTFSFNLPVPEGAGSEETAALAQRFVDLLTEHQEFKPCVSFGQDNGLVYATVPATSTQGAIKEEDKAKQAVGGVQLVRLSFPAQCGTAKVTEVIANAVRTIYLHRG